MNWQQFLPIASALGIGSILGICIQTFASSKQEKRRLLFEARIKAFSGITARLANLFLEPDMTGLQPEVFFVKLNHLLSETMLLGSDQLNRLIMEYRDHLMKFHEELDKTNKDKAYSDKDASLLHKKLIGLVGQILNQMRADLSVEKIRWGVSNK
jgi:hypothetical protein